MNARFHALALLVGLITAVASTWPVALHPFDHVIDGARVVSPNHPETWGAANIAADVLTTTWILNWDLHALRTQPFALFDANIFWPAPLALARSEHMVATALLGVPGLLVGGPVLAHQSALLLCVALATWSAAWAARCWTGSSLAAVAVGILYATMPFHQAQRLHLQNLGTAGLPLVLLGLERFGATGRVCWLAGATAALVWEMASGQYLAFFALVTWGVAGTMAAIMGRPTTTPLRRLAHDLTWLITASALAGILYLPLALPYFRLMSMSELPSELSHPWTNLGILSIREYFTGSARLWFVRLPLPLLGLAGLGALSWARTQPRRLAILLGLFLVGALTSVGPRPTGPGLYRLLAATVPGFQTLREPWRWVFLPQLAAVLLAGEGIAVMLRRRKFLGAASVPVLVGWSVVAASGGPVPLRGVPTGATLPEPYRYLQRCGAGDPLLELPAWPTAAEWHDAERDYFSTYHWLPLLNGRTGYSPPTRKRLMELGQGLPAAKALQTLRKSTGVRWILADCSAGRQTKRVCTGPGLVGVPRRRFGSYLLFDLGPASTLPRPTPRWPTPPDCTDGFVLTEDNGGKAPRRNRPEGSVP
jgi:hypothetical protein